MTDFTAMQHPLCFRDRLWLAYRVLWCRGGGEVYHWVDKALDRTFNRRLP